MNKRKITHTKRDYWWHSFYGIDKLKTKNARRYICLFRRIVRRYVMKGGEINV